MKWLLVGVLVIAAPLRAQDVAIPPSAAEDSAAAVRDSLIRNRSRGDSIRPRPPVSPGTAFFRSLLVPGWGQASLNRNVTGGMFVAFEGVAIMMVWKSGWQLDYARTRGKYVASHTQEKQDWMVLLAFNHLISGAEAFVSAHLYDFPAALKMETMADGRTAAFVTVRF